MGDYSSGPTPPMRRVLRVRQVHVPAGSTATSLPKPSRLKRNGTSKPRVPRSTWGCHRARSKGMRVRGDGPRFTSSAAVRGRQSFISLQTWRLGSAASVSVPRPNTTLEAVLCMSRARSSVSALRSTRIAPMPYRLIAVFELGASLAALESPRLRVRSGHRIRCSRRSATGQQQPSCPFVIY